MAIQFKKIAALLIGLFIILIFSYNKKEQIYAEEIPSIICMDIPQASTDNKLEIRIGRVTDQTEKLADQVLEKANDILDALDIDSSININNSCKLGNCSPKCTEIKEKQTCITGNCRKSSQTCIIDDVNVDTCENHGMVPHPDNNCRNSCSGSNPKCCHKRTISCYSGWTEVNDCDPELCGEFDKCCRRSATCPIDYQEQEYDDCNPSCGKLDKCCYKPPECKDGHCVGNACSSNLINTLNTLINRADIINEKVNGENGIKKIMEKEPKKIELILAQSRKRLFECSRAPTAQEALESEAEQTVLREYTILLNCTNVVESGIEIYSVLNETFQQGCYGYKYCQATGVSKPCAEDYFCCQ